MKTRKQDDQYSNDIDIIVFCQSGRHVIFYIEYDNRGLSILVLIFTYFLIFCYWFENKNDFLIFHKVYV